MSMAQENPFFGGGREGRERVKIIVMCQKNYFGCVNNVTTVLKFVSHSKMFVYGIMFHFPPSPHRKKGFLEPLTYMCDIKKKVFV
jgi:hypothetical protein